MTRERKQTKGNKEVSKCCGAEKCIVSPNDSFELRYGCSKCGKPFEKAKVEEKSPCCNKEIWWSSNIKIKGICSKCRKIIPLDKPNTISLPPTTENWKDTIDDILLDCCTKENCPNPEEHKFYPPIMKDRIIKLIGNLLSRQHKEDEAKIRLEIFEEIHKKIMGSENLEEIDFLEKVQKIVLSSLKKLQ